MELLTNRITVIIITMQQRAMDKIQQKFKKIKNQHLTFRRTLLKALN